MAETHTRMARPGVLLPAGRVAPLAAALLTALAVAGCTPGPNARITVTRAGAGSGRVTSSPTGIDCGLNCTNLFDTGTEVSLTATPDAGSVLSKWTGCDHADGYTCMVALRSDRTVTATFAPAPKTETLTVIVAGTGGGTVDDGQGFTCTTGTCTHDYPTGTEVTLTANRDVSSAFGAFTGCDGVSDVTTCLVSLTAPVTVTATFEALNGDVGGLTVTPGLQSLHLDWVDPPVATFDHARVYVTGPGQSGAPQDVTGTSFDVSDLVPAATYTVKVTAVDTSGAESTGVTATATTYLNGVPSNFLAGQSAATLAGNQVFLAWSDGATGNLYVGDTGSLAGDELWVALDTDPDAGDVTGKTRFTDPTDWACSGTCSQGAADVIWPFKADAVLALTESGNARLWTAADPTTPGAGGSPVPKWTPLTVVDGLGGVGLTAWGVNLAGLGLDGTTRARFAFVVIDPATGKTRDLAPASAGATDVTGYFSSLTSAFSATPFDLAGLGTSLQTPVAAARLVTVTVTDPTTTGPLRLMGSRHPFSDTLGDSSYQLAAGHTAGTWTGTFNLGGAAGELYFELTDGGTRETLGGAAVERVYGLSGATESLPPLVFGQSFDSRHPFTVDFAFTDTGSQGTPVALVGSAPELGNGTAGAGAPVSLVAGTPDRYAAQVPFGSGVDPSATPLSWRVAYAGGALESGAAHQAHLDVVGHATFRWTAGDGATFP